MDTQLKQFVQDMLSSKTMWASALLPVLVALVPPLAPLVAANPETAALAVGALFAGLRFVTKSEITPPVSMKPAPESNP